MAGYVCLYFVAQTLKKHKHIKQRTQLKAIIKALGYTRRAIKDMSMLTRSENNGCVCGIIVRILDRDLDKGDNISRLSNVIICC